MNLLTGTDAEQAFDRRDFHLMDKDTFLSISERRTEQAGFTWDDGAATLQGVLYDRLIRAREGIATLMTDCKCRHCPLNDLENDRWCKKGIEPAQCMRRIE